MAGSGDETRQAWIVAAAHAFPPKAVPNERLPETMKVDPASILKRTGIRSRYWADRGTATSDLGAQAVQNLLAQLGIEAKEIDCLILATQTPDQFLPGTGVIVQRKLGINDIPCFDVRDQCAGFLYSLQMARSFVETAVYKNVLILCSEINSHGLGFEAEDAHITALFGDGAAAVLVRPEPSGAPPIRPRFITLGADGTGEKRLRHRLWDSRYIPAWEPSEFDEPMRRVQFPEMDGEAVFRAAVKRMVSAGQKCLKTLGVTAADVNWLIPHQANATISKTVASILGFPPERVMSNIERVGNCSSASLPILLSEALKDSKIKPGQRMLMVAFGAGFTWGGAILESAS